MTILWGFRLFYFAVAVSGLVLAAKEYREARWLYRELVRKRINGARQLLAEHFVREERLRIHIQSLLLGIVLSGFYVASAPGLVIPRDVNGVVFLSQIFHILVAFLLMLKTLINRRDRRVIMNALIAETKPPDRSYAAL